MKDNFPIRKNLRLRDYDYSKNGIYFVTICTKNRKEKLGEIENNQIKLSNEGMFAQEYIKNIENIFSGVSIDEYIIMPNHIHAIISIDESKKVTVSKIINQYKGIITKQLGHCIWQKSYYDHIIRNEKEYDKIREYIQNNIINWELDKYF